MCLYLASCLFTFTLIGHLAHCTKQTDFHTSGTWGLWSSTGCSKPHKLETKAIISAIDAEIVFLSYQSSFSSSAGFSFTKPQFSLEHTILGFFLPFSSRGLPQLGHFSPVGLFQLMKPHSSGLFSQP